MPSWGYPADVTRNERRSSVSKTGFRRYAPTVADRSRFAAKLLGTRQSASFSEPPLAGFKGRSWPQADPSPRHR